MQKEKHGNNEKESDQATLELPGTVWRFTLPPIKQSHDYIIDHYVMQFHKLFCHDKSTKHVNSHFSDFRDCSKTIQYFEAFGALANCQTLLINSFLSLASYLAATGAPFLFS